MSSPSYYELVYYVTQQIPSGRVSTYGDIADYLSLGSARMVGWALGQCIHSEIGKVPAHRVVNSKGELSGRLRFGSPTRMEELLAAEGVAVKNDRVVDFKNLRWHPKEIEE